jgi:lysozyme family protein
MANFLLFFPTLEENEGFYANVPGDSGGETWIGISRNNYGSWSGFAIIDSYKINGVFPGNTYKDRVAYANKVLKSDAKLMALVVDFYENTEWHTIDGDQIESDSVADFLGDWCVNAGFSTPIKHLQQIVGVTADGKFGPGTLAAVNGYDAQSVFNALKAARIAFYHAVVAAHPTDEQFLEQWLERTNSFQFKG